MAVTESPQTSMEERIVDSDQLERQLEARESLRQHLSGARKTFAEADEQARAMIAEFSLTDGEVARCGRFRIAKRHIASRSVSFDTSESSRLSITCDKD